MKNARKIVRGCSTCKTRSNSSSGNKVPEHGSPATAIRCTELDFFPGAYKFDAQKALARLAVKYVLANEYLKLIVTV
jgi:hypothetical protein